MAKQGRPRELVRYEFSGIYQLTNTINSHIYIGQAQNIFTRLNEHRRNRNGTLIYRDCPLYRAIKKYGWDKFEISVIEKVDDILMLNEREVFWINELKPKYNIKEGGNCARGYKHSEDTKNKISETKKASKRNIGSNNPFYGKSHSEETKQKIREAKLGKKISNTSKMKEAYNPERFYKKVVNTNTLEVFNSVSDASKSIGVNQSSLSNCLRGKTKTCGGFKWKYYES